VSSGSNFSLSRLISTNEMGSNQVGTSGRGVDIRYLYFPKEFKYSSFSKTDYDNTPSGYGAPFGQVCKAKQETEFYTIPLPESTGQPRTLTENLPVYRWNRPVDVIDEVNGCFFESYSVFLQYTIRPLLNSNNYITYFDSRGVVQQTSQNNIYGIFVPEDPKEFRAVQINHSSSWFLRPNLLNKSTNGWTETGIADNSPSTANKSPLRVENTPNFLSFDKTTTNSSLSQLGEITNFTMYGTKATATTGLNYYGSGSAVNAELVAGNNSIFFRLNNLSIVGANGLTLSSNELVIDEIDISQYKQIIDKNLGFFTINGVRIALTSDGKIPTRLYSTITEAILRQRDVDIEDESAGFGFLRRNVTDANNPLLKEYRFPVFKFSLTSPRSLQYISYTEDYSSALPLNAGTHGPIYMEFSNREGIRYTSDDHIVKTNNTIYKSNNARRRIQISGTRNSTNQWKVIKTLKELNKEEQQDYTYTKAIISLPLSYLYYSSNNEANVASKGVFNLSNLEIFNSSYTPINYRINSGINGYLTTTRAAYQNVFVPNPSSTSNFNWQALDHKLLLDESSRFNFINPTHRNGLTGNNKLISERTVFGFGLQTAYNSEGIRNTYCINGECSNSPGKQERYGLTLSVDLLGLAKGEIPRFAFKTAYANALLFKPEITLISSLNGVLSLHAYDSIASTYSDDNRSWSVQNNTRYNVGLSPRGFAPVANPDRGLPQAFINPDEDPNVYYTDDYSDYTKIGYGMQPTDYAKIYKIDTIGSNLSISIPGYNKVAGPKFQEVFVVEIEKKVDPESGFTIFEEISSLIPLNQYTTRRTNEEGIAIKYLGIVFRRPNIVNGTTIGYLNYAENIPFVKYVFTLDNDTTTIFTQNPIEQSKKSRIKVSDLPFPTSLQYEGNNSTGNIANISYLTSDPRIAVSFTVLQQDGRTEKNYSTSPRSLYVGQRVRISIVPTTRFLFTDNDGNALSNQIIRTEFYPVITPNDLPVFTLFNDGVFFNFAENAGSILSFNGVSGFGDIKDKLNSDFTGLSAALVYIEIRRVGAIVSDDPVFYTANNRNLRLQVGDQVRLFAIPSVGFSIPNSLFEPTTDRIYSEWVTVNLVSSSISSESFQSRVAGNATKRWTFANRQFGSPLSNNTNSLPITVNSKNYGNYLAADNYVNGNASLKIFTIAGINDMYSNQLLVALDGTTNFFGVSSPAVNTRLLTQFNFEYTITTTNKETGAIIITNYFTPFANFSDVLLSNGDRVTLRITPRVTSFASSTYYFTNKDGNFVYNEQSITQEFLIDGILDETTPTNAEALVSRINSISVPNYVVKSVLSSKDPYTKISPAIINYLSNLGIDDPNDENANQINFNFIGWEVTLTNFRDEDGIFNTSKTYSTIGSNLLTLSPALISQQISKISSSSITIDSGFQIKFKLLNRDGLVNPNFNSIWYNWEDYTNSEDEDITLPLVRFTSEYIKIYNVELNVQDLSIRNVIYKNAVQSNSQDNKVDSAFDLIKTVNSTSIGKLITDSMNDNPANPIKDQISVRIFKYLNKPNTTIENYFASNFSWTPQNTTSFTYINHFGSFFDSSSSTNSSAYSQFVDITNLTSVEAVEKVGRDNKVIVVISANNLSSDRTISGLGLISGSSLNYSSYYMQIIDFKSTYDYLFSSFNPDELGETPAISSSTFDPKPFKQQIISLSDEGLNYIVDTVSSISKLDYDVFFSPITSISNTVSKINLTDGISNYQLWSYNFNPLLTNPDPTSAAPVYTIKQLNEYIDRETDFVVTSVPSWVVFLIPRNPKQDIIASPNLNGANSNIANVLSNTTIKNVPTSINFQAFTFVFPTKTNTRLPLPIEYFKPSSQISNVGGVSFYNVNPLANLYDFFEFPSTNTSSSSSQIFKGVSGSIVDNYGTGSTRPRESYISANLNEFRLDAFKTNILSQKLRITRNNGQYLHEIPEFNELIDKNNWNLDAFYNSVLEMFRINYAIRRSVSILSPADSPIPLTGVIDPTKDYSNIDLKLAIGDSIEISISLSTNTPYFLISADGIVNNGNITLAKNFGITSYSVSRNANVRLEFKFPNFITGNLQDSFVFSGLKSTSGKTFGKAVPRNDFLIRSVVGEFLYQISTDEDKWPTNWLVLSSANNLPEGGYIRFKSVVDTSAGYVVYDSESNTFDSTAGIEVISKAYKVPDFYLNYAIESYLDSSFDNAIGSMPNNIKLIWEKVPGASYFGNRIVIDVEALSKLFVATTGEEILTLFARTSSRYNGPVITVIEKRYRYAADNSGIVSSFNRKTASRFTSYSHTFHLDRDINGKLIAVVQSNNLLPTAPGYLIPTIGLTDIEIEFDFSNIVFNQLTVPIYQSSLADANPDTLFNSFSRNITTWIRNISRATLNLSSALSVEQLVGVAPTLNTQYTVNHFPFQFSQTKGVYLTASNSSAFLSNTASYFTFIRPQQDLVDSLSQIDQNIFNVFPANVRYGIYNPISGVESVYPSNDEDNTPNYSNPSSVRFSNGFDLWAEINSSDINEFSELTVIDYSGRTTVLNKNSFLNNESYRFYLLGNNTRTRDIVQENLGFFRLNAVPSPSLININDMQWVNPSVRIPYNGNASVNWKITTNNQYSADNDLASWIFENVITRMNNTIGISLFTKLEGTVTSSLNAVTNFDFLLQDRQARIKAFNDFTSYSKYSSGDRVTFKIEIRPDTKYSFMYFAQSGAIVTPRNDVTSSALTIPTLKIPVSPTNFAAALSQLSNKYLNNAFLGYDKQPFLNDSLIAELRSVPQSVPPFNPFLSTIKYQVFDPDTNTPIRSLDGNLNNNSLRLTNPKPLTYIEVSLEINQGQYFWFDQSNPPSNGDIYFSLKTTFVIRNLDKTLPFTNELLAPNFSFTSIQDSNFNERFRITESQQGQQTRLLNNPVTVVQFNDAISKWRPEVQGWSLTTVELIKSFNLNVAYTIPISEFINLNSGFQFLNASSQVVRLERGDFIRFILVSSRLQDGTQPLFVANNGSTVSTTSVAMQINQVSKSSKFVIDEAQERLTFTGYNGSATTSIPSYLEKIFQQPNWQSIVTVSIARTNIGITNPNFLPIDSVNPISSFNDYISSFGIKTNDLVIIVVELIYKNSFTLEIMSSSNITTERADGRYSVSYSVDNQLTTLINKNDYLFSQLNDLKRVFDLNQKDYTYGFNTVGKIRAPVYDTNGNITKWTDEFSFADSILISDPSFAEFVSIDLYVSTSPITNTTPSAKYDQLNSLTNGLYISFKIYPNPNYQFSDEVNPNNPSTIQMYVIDLKKIGDEVFYEQLSASSFMPNRIGYVYDDKIDDYKLIFYRTSLDNVVSTYEMPNSFKPFLFYIDSRQLPVKIQNFKEYLQTIGLSTQQYVYFGLSIDDQLGNAVFDLDQNGNPTRDFYRTDYPYEISNNNNPNRLPTDPGLPAPPINIWATESWVISINSKLTINTRNNSPFNQGLGNAGIDYIVSIKRGDTVVATTFYNSISQIDSLQIQIGDVLTVTLVPDNAKISNLGNANKPLQFSFNIINQKSVQEPQLPNSLDYKGFNGTAYTNLNIATSLGYKVTIYLYDEEDNQIRVQENSLRVENLKNGYYIKVRIDANQDYAILSNEGIVYDQGIEKIYEKISGLEEYVDTSLQTTLPLVATIVSLILALICSGIILKMYSVRRASASKLMKKNKGNK
jgi:hypothetical protein